MEAHREFDNWNVDFQAGSPLDNPIDTVGNDGFDWRNDTGDSSKLGD